MLCPTLFEVTVWCWTEYRGKKNTTAKSRSNMWQQLKILGINNLLVVITSPPPIMSFVHTRCIECAHTLVAACRNLLSGWQIHLRYSLQRSKSDSPRELAPSRRNLLPTTIEPLRHMNPKRNKNRRYKVRDNIKQ